MLNLLGTIGGNVLSLPGILGLALGMTTRNPILGASMGGVIGVIETFVFAKFQFANVETLELVIAICVGMAAGALGSAIRIKGSRA